MLDSLIREAPQPVAATFVLEEIEHHGLLDPGTREQAVALARHRSFGDASDWIAERLAA